jgi:hypothetical protein
MWRMILFLVAFLLVSCSGRYEGETGEIQPDPFTSGSSDSGEVQASATPSPDPTPLPNLGPAPNLTNDVWLNTDKPLPLSELRGKVVLLEMWTFG